MIPLDQKNDFLKQSHIGESDYLNYSSQILKESSWHIDEQETVRQEAVSSELVRLHVNKRQSTKIVKTQRYASGT